jgi:hypothetical protein
MRARPLVPRSICPTLEPASVETRTFRRLSVVRSYTLIMALSDRSATASSFLLEELRAGSSARVSELAAGSVRAGDTQPAALLLCSAGQHT